MGLIQVSTSTITGTPSSVTLDGINTDDVYVLVASGLTITVDTAYLHFRVTKDVSGTTTTQTTAKYCYTNKILKADGATENFALADRNTMYFGNTPIGSQAGESSNIIYTLFNFNNSSEYSFITVEENIFSSTNNTTRGSQGALVYKVNEANNGITITGDACNLNGGTLTLYKQVS